MAKTQQAIQEFINTEDAKMQSLNAFLQIPSVSADPEMKPHVLEAADFLKSLAEGKDWY